MVIRDRANQQQDVNALSRDTDNANGGIGPIFDKEKEQNRLKQAQLIGEIAGQTMDIVRTQGDINGLQKAKDKHPGLDAKALRKHRNIRPRCRNTAPAAICSGPHKP
ncbi:hypothetical protein [Serratia liquefaciens]|uniref:hypothetical protein n=1 Tax=Serratia liquefaciens TaxID=614 RepID=UPI0021C88B00|nr:hypothetical protein [Serratia liquefaciens]